LLTRGAKRWSSPEPRCPPAQVILAVTATLSRQFHCCSQKEMRYNQGVVSPVPAPGVRHWQRWGAEHSVKRETASSTPDLWWEMRGMDNASKASSLHIVMGAELELPFGSRAKMATVVRQASIDGGPAHSQHPPVYRGVLTPSVKSAVRGKPVWLSWPCNASVPEYSDRKGGRIAMQVEDARKKRRPPCNGTDRGSNFASPERELTSEVGCNAPAGVT
jgi:hypothetical protein